MREYTRLDAAEIERLRRMTPDEKLRIAAGLRRMLLSAMKQGLRDRFPDMNEEALDEKLGGILHGREFWSRACRLRRNA